MNDVDLIWESYVSKILLEESDTDINIEFIDKLKNDYDIIIKNIGTKLTPENATKLKDPFLKVINYYDDISTLMYKWGENKKIHTAYVRQPLWELLSHLRDIKYELEEYSKRRDEHNLKKLINLKRLANKKANLTWTEFKRFLENNPNLDLKLNLEKHTFKVDGIPFIFIGLNDKNKSRLPRLKYYINSYVERARKVAPLMLRYGLPVEIHMEFDTYDNSNSAGLYEYNKIILTAWASKENKEEAFIRVLAHEMGHHIYKSLSEESRNFWYEFIISDKIEIDVEEIVNMMGENEKSRDFETRMKTENPILYLQAEALFHNYATSHYGIYDLQSLVDAYKNNQIKGKVVVPNTPITGYANKNAEEAFCEALGLYVAYGNRAVNEKIKSVLNVILAPSDRFRLGESTDFFVEE